MKILILLSLMLFQTQSIAQSIGPEVEISIGEKVYRGSIYPEGGKVVYVDVANELAYLRVRIENNREVVVTEKYEDLSVTHGCYDELCVGDEVFLKDSNEPLMKVVGVNVYSKALLIKGQLASGQIYLFEHPASELMASELIKK